MYVLYCTVLYCVVLCCVVFYYKELEERKKERKRGGRGGYCRCRAGTAPREGRVVLCCVGLCCTINTRVQLVSW